MTREPPPAPKPGDPPHFSRLPLDMHMGWPLTVLVLVLAAGLVISIAVLQPRIAPGLPAGALYAIPAVLFGVAMIQLYRTLLHERRLARTDALTHLGNRRFFEHVAHTELNRSRRYRRPFALAYMDVDHFKTVNDERGHLAGDRLLQVIARQLIDGLRRSDVVTRFGGDEFAILLPETPLEGARTAMEKMQERLRDVVRGAGFEVTFSTGVIVYDGGPASIHALMGEADRIMYAVKSAGGDRVLCEQFGRPDARQADSMM